MRDAGSFDVAIVGAGAADELIPAADGHLRRGPDGGGAADGIGEGGDGRRLRLRLRDGRDTTPCEARYEKEAHRGNLPVPAPVPNHPPLRVAPGFPYG